MYSPLEKAALMVVVEWEISALRGTGGYSVFENNLCTARGGSSVDGTETDTSDTQESHEDNFFKWSHSAPSRLMF